MCRSRTLPSSAPLGTSSDKFPLTWTGARHSSLTSFPERRNGRFSGSSSDLLKKANLTLFYLFDGSVVFRGHGGSRGARRNALACTAGVVDADGPRGVLHGV